MYKTNKYSIPLLYLISVIRVSIYVLIAYAFIAGKDVDKYS